MIFHTTGMMLGIAIANLINIFNFPLYLLSGGVLAGWDEFAPSMMAEIQKRSFTYRNTKTRVEKATLGNEAGLVRRRLSAFSGTASDRGTTCTGLESISAPAVSRALLVDEKRRCQSRSFTAAHEDMRMERPLWAEQRPENWWDAAQDAIRGVLRRVGASSTDVRGIGLSGQMHGLTLLDAEDEVIRPALIWCDQRSQAQVDYVNDEGRTRQRPRVHGESGGHRLHAAETALGPRQ